MLEARTTPGERQERGGGWGGNQGVSHGRLRPWGPAPPVCLAPLLSRWFSHSSPLPVFWFFSVSLSLVFKISLFRDLMAPLFLFLRPFLSSSVFLLAYFFCSLIFLTTLPLFHPTHPTSERLYFPCGPPPSLFPSRKRVPFLSSAPFPLSPDPSFYHISKSRSPSHPSSAWLHLSLRVSLLSSPAPSIAPSPALFFFSCLFSPPFSALLHP